MTDKERLKDLKGMDVNVNTKAIEMSYEDYEWLIEQAERVEESEKKLEIVMDKHTYLEGDYYKIERQNKPYREALGKIRSNWVMSTDAISGGVLAYEFSQLARKALEETE